MTPRYDEEEAYYDKIVQKYAEINPAQLSGPAEEYLYRELRELMKDLDVNDPDFKTRMSQIAQNTIVLLLSLFTKHDETVNYKDFEELDAEEKALLIETMRANA